MIPLAQGPRQKLELAARFVHLGTKRALALAGHIFFSETAIRFFAKMPSRRRRSWVPSRQQARQSARSRPADRDCRGSARAAQHQVSIA
jgi:hypothetical protein